MLAVILTASAHVIHTGTGFSILCALRAAFAAPDPLFLRPNRPACTSNVSDATAVPDSPKNFLI
jgi:hypothetical protein